MEKALTAEELNEILEYVEYEPEECKKLDEIFNRLKRNIKTRYEINDAIINDMFELQKLGYVWKFSINDDKLIELVRIKRT